MASEYGYTTLAALENYAKVDYSTIDSVAFSDSRVESTITDAEYFINTYVGTTFTDTIPDGIKLTAKMIAKIYLNNFMIEHRIGAFKDEQGVIVDILEQDDIISILEQYKDEYSAEEGIWVSKHTNVAVTSTYRRPTSW